MLADLYSLQSCGLASLRGKCRPQKGAFTRGCTKTKRRIFMKKIFLKSMVAAAVVGAAVALSSVVAFAATTYNFADVTNRTSDGYNSNSVSTLATSSSENLTFSFSDNDANTITVNGKLKPAFINFNNNETTGKNYLENGATTGTLTGTDLTDILFSTSSGNGSNAFMTVSDVNLGDVVEVYYVSTDSKGAPGKAGSILVKDGGDTSFTDSTVLGTPSATTTGYLSFTATADGSVSILPKSGRIGVAAIVITPASEAKLVDGTYDATVTENGKVIVSGNTAYVIAPVSTTKQENNDSLDIVLGNNTTINSDSVYSSAIIDGETVTAKSLGTKYLYAVEVDGIANTADLACVRAFKVNFNSAE
jgi:hypothetical protein